MKPEGIIATAANMRYTGWLNHVSHYRLTQLVLVYGEWCRRGGGTHVDVQPQGRHRRGLAHRQHHEEQPRRQLHHVEGVIVGEQVGCQRLGVPWVREELVVVLTFLQK